MRVRADVTWSTRQWVVPPLQISLEGRTQKIIELVSCGAAYTIRDLASQLRLSSSYLQRLFKQQSGMRLGAWLTEQRLLRAAHLLQHSYMSVKQITHTVGYEHVSSFTRAFERRFDHAPTLYRKQGWEHSTPDVVDSPTAVGAGGKQ
jgi:AraC-like DNA-binding protein